MYCALCHEGCGDGIAAVRSTSLHFVTKGTTVLGKPTTKRYYFCSEQCRTDYFEDRDVSI